MSAFSRFFLFVALAGFPLILPVAGCAAQGTKYLRVEKMTPPSHLYEKTLFLQYLELAREQNARADWGDSDVFAARAAAVARGITVLPEEISARNLPQDAVIPLTKARKRLMRAIEHPESKNDRTAKELAAAQTQFDCWMEKQEENFQNDQIKACRKGFKTALKKVESIIFAPFGRQEWVLYFDYKKDDLRDDAATTVATILELAERHPDTQFVLNAHTDLAGGEAYNLNLSKRRAETVMRTLTSGGIAANRIKTVDSWGQSQPAVITEDGIAHPENRRVTVLMKDIEN